MLIYLQLCVGFFRESSDFDIWNFFSWDFFKKKRFCFRPFWFETGPPACICSFLLSVSVKWRPLHEFFSDRGLHTHWQHIESTNCIARALFGVCNTQLWSNCSPRDAGIHQQWNFLCWLHRPSACPGRFYNDVVTTTPQESRDFAPPPPNSGHVGFGRVGFGRMGHPTT